MSWPTIVTFLQRWQWLLAAIVAGIPTLYYGPRKVLQAWDWYLNRWFDEPVMEIIRERRFYHAADKPPREEPYSVGELAKSLERRQQSIGKSIKRLRRQDRIELYRGGFRPKQ
jgi:hypothetical protein